MNLFKLSFSYLRRRSLNTWLNVLLLSFGIATVVLLLLFTHQLEDNLYKNAEGVDVVVGAKGSPIQLILSSIYHIDNPTGNIELGEAKQLMRHPMVATAIPLALGDNYLGYRIVGTTTDYLKKYGAELADGTLWDHEFELIAGAEAARNANLHIGDTIVSAHGFAAEGHTHDDHDLYIVGILEPTGTVLDRLLMGGVETMWGIHEDHDYDEDGDHEHEHDHEDEHATAHAAEVVSNSDEHGHSHSHNNHDHNNHNHDHDDHQHHHDDEAEEHLNHEHHHGHDHSHGRDITDESFLSDEYDDEQITSMLIKYQNPLAAAQFPRFVNEQTSMQAAAPSMEITRLLNLLGVGIDAIRLFAFVLILASVLGIFIALFNSMKERKYDLAIMRTLGGSRLKLFSHVMLEGLMISLAGGVLGILLGHIALEFIGVMFAEAQQFAVTGLVFLPGELAVLGLALIVGMIASVIPAFLAYKTEITQTLSKI